MKARIIPTLILGTAIAGLAQSPPPPTGKKAASAFGAAAKPGISIVKQPDGTAFIADAPKSNPRDTSADVRIIKRQDGTLSIEDVNKGSRATASPKAATGSTLTLVFTKYAEPGTSQRLTVTDAADPSKPFQGGYRPTPDGAGVTADPMATGTRQLTNPVAPAPFATRLYSLKALITKAPAEIDDDAHIKKAADAYQAKVEALLGWVKTVLAHSEPAEASFEFSPEAGAFVVKATEAQHDALMQGVAIFEDNYGR